MNWTYELFIITLSFIVKKLDPLKLKASNTLL